MKEIQFIRATLSIVLFLILINPIQAQKVKDHKFYNITEIGYGHGFGKISFKEPNFSSRYEGYFIRLRTQFGILITNQLSAGLGFGLDGYHVPGSNTAPLFLDGRYYWRDKPQTFFTGVNLGYSIPINSSVFQSGVMGSVLIGRRISGKRLIYVPSIGLNIQQIRNFRYTIVDLDSNQFYTGEQSVIHNTLAFNLGFMF